MLTFEKTAAWNKQWKKDKVKEKWDTITKYDEGGKNANFICIIWSLFWQMNWMWAMYKLVSH